MNATVAKKHIVLLTDCLVDSAAGGAERNVFELAKRLDKNKFTVTIASLECEGEGSGEYVESFGCQLATFKVKKIYSLSGIWEGFKFYRFLRREKVDVLQTYHFASDIWGTFFAHFAGVPKIISSRRDMGFWRNQRHIKIYRWINPWVSRICVVSNAVKEIVIREEGVPQDKVQVIFNGVDLNAYKPEVNNKDLKVQSGIKDGDLVLMHVGNLKPVKGHEYLVRAFADVVQKFPEAVLVLIGEDELNGAMEKLADELGIRSRIYFLGKRHDVKSLLTMADICILPSLSEGMSNAVLEYMAFAKPVVATAVGGNLDNVVDGKMGFLVPPKDSEALAEAIKKLCADKRLRLSMGQAGRNRIEDDFDINKMVRRYEGVYLEG